MMFHVFIVHADNTSRVYHAETFAARYGVR